MTEECRCVSASRNMMDAVAMVGGVDFRSDADGGAIDIPSEGERARWLLHTNHQYLFSSAAAVCASAFTGRN